MLIGCLVELIDLFLSAFLVGHNRREGAGPMEVKIRIEVISVVAVDLVAQLLVDMFPAHILPNDTAILGFHQSVITRVVREGLRLLDK